LKIRKEALHPGSTYENHGASVKGFLRILSILFSSLVKISIVKGR
jgi:hypothetical protein